jgi:hypothetical protein
VTTNHLFKKKKFKILSLPTIVLNAEEKKTGWSEVLQKQADIQGRRHCVGRTGI